jgi:hypothetical protein
VSRAMRVVFGAHGQLVMGKTYYVDFTERPATT